MINCGFFPLEALVDFGLGVAVLRNVQCATVGSADARRFPVTGLGSLFRHEKCNFIAFNYRIDSLDVSSLC